MEPEPTLVLRDLRPDDLGAACRIIATAFAGEAFAVGMFGESPLHRLVGMTGEYGDWPWATDPIAMVAETDGLVVGVASATVPGDCHPCDHLDPAEPEGMSRSQRIEHEFQSACRTADLSASLPPHADIATVATDMFLQGSGIGRRVVQDLIDRVWLTGAECVVLECLTTREAFYRRCGFRRVVEFADPGGPGLRSVLMRRDAGTEAGAGDENRTRVLSLGS